MTTALYKQIFKNNSYREKVKNAIEFNNVIDHLISKDIVSEKQYMKIWNDPGNKLDLLFDILNSKSHKELTECFTIFNLVYGDEFEILLKEIARDIVESAHLKGGFPKINNYVPRVKEEAKIKEKLVNIRWDNSLVVHGRVGEGKSYIVGECLKDIELILEHFDNRLFWINVGECENGSNILQPLTRLLRMVLPKKGKDYELNDLVEKLQRLFSSEKHRRSLVVLDNARSLEVIEIFQRIRCKLIIITHFKTVKNAAFIDVDSGFTLAETITLFAQYLETSTENLSNHFSDDIKDIHELCKGHPSTLALLGVILSFQKVHALASKELWDYIKEKIDKGEIEDLGSHDVDIIRRNFHEALRMCIDTIRTDEMKELYYQFSIFPKDANISTEVLEIFWGKRPQEVWEIMHHFENRSLISSFYSINKKAYIYVIHDLFLYYLKNETKARKKEFHQKLITAYESRYKFHMLPDDNYILLFLGYHLKQADMIEKFEGFLDLRFIEHKIRIVGVNNMEQDLRMYADEIVNGNHSLQEKLENCQKFIKANKNELRQLEKTDIIQLALPTLKDDAQILMAKNEAKSINKLYFTIKLSAGRLKSSQELVIKEEVTAMAFCTDSNVSKVLLGLTNGDILLYCSQTNKEFDRFQGHKKLVFDLKVADDNSCFLSVSQDRTVKLWQFYSQRLSLGTDDLPTSPKCVQNEHFQAFNTTTRSNFREFVYNEDKDYLISANFSSKCGEIKKICTGTNNGRIILWNTHTKEKLFITTETGYPAENIHLLYNDSKILLTKQEKIQFYKYENEELNYCESICNIEDVNKLFVPNENTLISVGARHVMMYKLPYEGDSSRVKVYESKENNITCSAIAQGECLAIGINENVFLFNVSKGELVETLKHNKIVTSISMDVSTDDDSISSMILMNFDDNNIQQCNIMMQYYGEPRNREGLVTTYWKNKNLPMLALVSNDNLNMKIQHEFSTINEVEIQQKISFITFSLCGNNIIYSLENGDVVEYQYKRQGCFRTLMELNSAVKYLECFDFESPTVSNSTERSYNSSDSRNGVVLAITEGDKKIHILYDGDLYNFSWDVSIFHVFPLGSHDLLCIDESGGLFTIRNLKSSKDIKLIRYAIWCRKLTSAAFSPINNLVANTFLNKDNLTTHLEVVNIKSGVVTRKSLQFVPNCCAFSYLGDLVVLGGKGGEIVVYNVETNFRHKSLCTSGVPMKLIQFSRSELPILVTVGREVSWWNLYNCQSNSSERNDTRRDNEFDLKFWENKTIHNEIPHLLQTVSLYSNAVHFSVSKNFETFLVVDDENRIYVMKCYKNNQ